MSDPLVAPRDPRCKVCTGVAEPYVVTDLLFGSFKKGAAADYLRSVGFPGEPRKLGAIVARHRRHVMAFMARGGAVAPAQIAEGISVIPSPERTPWVELNQSQIDVGARATALANARLDDMEDSDLIAVMRVGGTAATTRATLEMKGAIRRQEEMDRLAAGLSE